MKIRYFHGSFRLAAAALLGLVLAASGFGLWLATREESGTWTRPSGLNATVEAEPVFRFADVTAGSGVAFAYRNGEETGLRAILESLGGGVGLFDFDGDGRLDLFVIGGGSFETTSEGFQVRGRPNALFRNEGAWRFREVTAEVGLDGTDFYGHGCAVGDFDNDGHPDLLVTSYQGVRLYRNEQGRRFVDVTAEAGLDQPGWATAAAWLDFDHDGWIDLYVVRYVNWSPENHPSCRYRTSGRDDICAPTVFEALDDSLYRNQGDGTFVEVSREAGLEPGGKGLGVVACDLDGDGWIDLYVANDTTPNVLYRNRRDGTLESIGAASGAQLSSEGIPTGSMGVDAADIDGDGLPDLWVTNYEGETNELYRNEGGMVFTPVGLAVGLGAVSRPLVGWGTGLFDLDNDGRLDVLVVNGHLMHHLPRSPMAQRPLLFHHGPDGRFEDVGPSAGAYFEGTHQARGCAFGDLDNDGDLDIVIVHQNQPVVLLRNDSAPARHALQLRLEGTRSNRSAIGARVVVEANGQRQTRSLVGGGSYLSANDPRFLFGLDTRPVADIVEVSWPSGVIDLHEGLSAGHPWLLREGQPAVVDPRSDP